MENMTAADMSKHVERLKAKLGEARKRIQETEKEYRKQSQIQYSQVPVRGTSLKEYARVAPTTTLPPGAFVIVKRAPGPAWFAMKSAGPYMVMKDMGERVQIIALASGRVEVEAKTNVRLLRGWIKGEASQG